MNLETKSWFEPSPEVVWAVEAGGVRLIHRSSACSLALGYPEAGLWDLVSRRVPKEEATRIFASLAGMDPTEAEAAIRQLLSGWADNGWLVERG